MPARVVVVRRSRRRVFAPLWAVPFWIRSLGRAMRAAPLASLRPALPSRPGSDLDPALAAPARWPALRSTQGTDADCGDCARCVEACPSRCLFLSTASSNGAGESTLELDAGACIGCGRCVEVCPGALLEMRPAPRADWAASIGRRVPIAGAGGGSVGA